MREWINGFWVASQFLTIVPPIIERPFTPSELGRAVGFFPLVGLLLGLVLVGVNFGLAFLLPASVRLVLILALWVVLTGVLHLDGFLDACDGLFGGFTPEKRLEIMRDERVGAYALAGGVLLLLLLYMLLLAVESADSFVPALLLAPVLGRWGMSVAMIHYPYARPTGLGRTMKDEAGRGELVLATLTAVLLAILVGKWVGFIALLGVVLIVVGGARFVKRRIPGLTGDIYGLLCVLSETAVLLVSVIVGQF